MGIERERKAAYLRHLPDVTDDGVLRVARADKVHNARSLVRDRRVHGDAIWERLADEPPDEQMWYFRELLRFFSERRPGPLTEDLRRARAELITCVGDARRRP